MLRTALLASSLLAMGCASDGATAPADSTQFETRLSAAASAPTTPLSGRNLTLNVVVRNSLAEEVSGDVCATLVQARSGGTSWTDVTSESYACPAIAVIVPAGGSSTFTGAADTDKVRAVLGGTTGTVVFRVQHSLSGASGTYLFQSNEVSWTAN